MLLKELLKLNKMTQNELAEKLSITDTAISKWANGKTLPDIYTVIKLSEILGVSTDVLLEANRKGYVQVEMEQEEAIELVRILEGIIAKIKLQINGDVHVNIAENMTINMNERKSNHTINNDDKDEE